MDQSFTLEQPKLPPPEHPLKKKFFIAVVILILTAFVVANVMVFFPALIPISLKTEQEPIQQPQQHITPPSQPPQQQPSLPVQPPPEEKKVYTGQGTKIYVINELSNDVWYINLDEESVIKKIPVGKRPTFGYWDDEGLYVANTADNSISVIDTFKNEVEQTIQVGETPLGIAAIKDEIYVVSADDDVVKVINKKTKEENDIFFLKHPRQMILNNKKDRLYVTNANSNELSIVNPFIRNIVKNIVVGTTPESIAVSNDESLAIVTNKDSNDVSFIPLKLGKESRRIHVGINPVHVAFVSPENQIALIALKDEHKIAVLSLNTFEVIKKIDVDAPTFIVMIGDRAYISSYTKNKVYILDTQRLKIIGDIPTGLGPFSIVVKENSD